MILLIVGIGYVFAMIQSSRCSRAWIKPGLAVRNLLIAYAGNPNDSRLDSALPGPMAAMAVKQIIACVRAGADEREYQSESLPILRLKCLMCHADGDSRLARPGSYA
jgi:hypothetical protein